MSATDQNEKIAAMIEAGDDSLDVGDADHDSEAAEAENTSPRSWGFDVEEINRIYALALWGGKAVVVKEQRSGPVQDRVRLMTLEFDEFMVCQPIHGNRGVRRQG